MVSMRRELPRGTVTFLFTDVEGSTRLLRELGPERYAKALAEHRRVLRRAFAAHNGVEVDTQGDAFFVAFPSAPGAVHAAAQALEGLAAGPIRVRMGIHTGKPHVTEEGYVGVDVHRAARIAAAGHGGQALVSAATAALLGTDGLTDLGEHRLKDFDEPVSVYQLGGERFPPLKTISNTNLPRPASSFVGRQREVEEVLAMLRHGARLLTLTGPGGSGKTRLAIEAAAELVPEFKAGVFWVSLASLRDPAVVTETIAGTLGAKDGLAEHIAERELLLLLDNFEQVIEAASDLPSLVERCPNLHLLVTSRELLKVRGERAYPVLALVPDEGRELFLARARSTDPGFVPGPALAELCATLENLPLALELAAARVTVLSVEQLLERLSRRLDLLKAGRGVDPRQQTLRATIEWSHELLDQDEQRLFARFAVFAGGCTLNAAERVVEADLDVLQSLVDKSLLRRTDGRFRMLETIREYALERLEDSGEADELRRRHAKHFVALAEEAEPHLFGGEASGEWLDRIGREHDNVRAALDHLQACGETQLALRLAGAVWEFWRDRAHFAEGRRRLESILRVDERPTAARGRALNAAASMAALGGNAARGRQWADEGLALHRMLGDKLGTAESELWLGWAVANEGDWRTAQPLVDDSVQLFRELGDEHQALTATLVLAMTYAEEGDWKRARALNEDNLRRALELGNEQVKASTLGELARCALAEGRFEDAASKATESLRTYTDLGDPHGVAIELRRCAGALALKGEAATAARLLSSAEALHEEIGGTMPWLARMRDDALASIRTQLDEAAFAEAWEQGRTLTTDAAVALALDSLG
jgi:predicted ATPase/class 3 adenylate cyclase